MNIGLEAHAATNVPCSARQPARVHLPRRPPTLDGNCHRRPAPHCRRHERALVAHVSGPERHVGVVLLIGSPGWETRRPGSRTLGGDVESRNQLVQANLGLVHRVARQYVNRGLTFDDLVGEGNLGLIRAAQEYDPSLGTRFSTYANYWIRDAIRAALANTAATIRLPMNIAKLLGRWRRTEKALYHLCLVGWLNLRNDLVDLQRSRNRFRGSLGVAREHDDAQAVCSKSLERGWGTVLDRVADGDGPCERTVYREEHDRASGAAESIDFILDRVG